MNYEMSTLQQRDMRINFSEALCFQGRFEEQAQDNQGTTTTNASSQKKRYCKECNCEVGKRMQRCKSCQSIREIENKARNLDKKRENDRIRARIRRGSLNRSSFKEIKFRNGAVNHFKRDSSGNIIEKFCTVCETWKSSGEYRKRKSTPSGLFFCCNQCDRNRQRHKQKQKTNSRSLLGFCIVCDKSFKAKNSRSKHCSMSCYDITEMEQRKIRVLSARSVFTIKDTDLVMCRKCNTEKPLDEFKKKNHTLFKCMPTSCNSCYTQTKRKHKRLKEAKLNKEPIVRIKKNLRRRMSDMIKTKGFSPLLAKSKYIGCNASFLKLHLSSMFTKKMRWDNYGTYWHVDHILPVASFDHTKEEEIKKCWHWSNLRPLEAQENMDKSDSIISCQPELLLAM